MGYLINEFNFGRLERYDPNEKMEIMSEYVSQAFLTEHFYIFHSINRRRQQKTSGRSISTTSTKREEKTAKEPQQQRNGKKSTEKKKIIIAHISEIYGFYAVIYACLFTVRNT